MAINKYNHFGPQMPTREEAKKEWAKSLAGAISGTISREKAVQNIKQANDKDKFLDKYEKNHRGVDGLTARERMKSADKGDKARGR